MNIKKVDDKPMVIHTKEKTKLHVKTAPETKIKAGNVLTVERTPKFAGAEREAKADNMDKRMSALKVKGKKALNKVSEFLRIKEKLQKLRNNVQKSITDVEQSIEKIDALGTGMREAVQKAANTIRVFANKPEKEYGEKKFSKIELIKKPLQAKRKLLCGILGYADAAIENVEKLSADVKQYQSERTDREVERMAGAEMIDPIALSRVAEPEYQYGAEAFEAQQQETTKVMSESMATKDVPAMNGKSR